MASPQWDRMSDAEKDQFSKNMRDWHPSAFVSTWDLGAGDRTAAFVMEPRYEVAHTIMVDDPQPFISAIGLVTAEVPYQGYWCRVLEVIEKVEFSFLSGPRPIVDVGWPIKFCREAATHECTVHKTPRLDRAIRATLGW